MTTKQWHQCHACRCSRRVHHEARATATGTVHICQDCAKKEKTVAREMARLAQWNQAASQGESKEDGDE